MNFEAFVFKPGVQPSVEEAQHALVAGLRDNQEQLWAAVLLGYVLRTGSIRGLHLFPYQGVGDLEAFIDHARRHRRSPSPEDAWAGFIVHSPTGQPFHCCFAFREVDVDREVQSGLLMMKKALNPLVQKGLIGQLPDKELLGALFPGQIVRGTDNVWVAFDVGLGGVRDAQRPGIAVNVELFGVRFSGPCVVAKKSNVGDSTEVGPFVFVQASTIGAHCRLKNTYIVESQVGDRVIVEHSSIKHAYVGSDNRIINTAVSNTVIPEGRFR